MMALMATGSNIFTDRDRLEFFSADRMMGKTFRFLRTTAPDFTIVATGPEGFRVHGADGARVWLPFNDLCEAIESGAIIEVPIRPIVWSHVPGVQS